jgi:C4-dicarboxylate-specific signal transduction histidine kinase
MFDPFFSTKPGGLGLGLSISRSIIERFGGQLLAENHPDGGAVFRMVLPLAES